MAIYGLSDHFKTFFSRLNPGASFEAQASSQYNTIKGLIEDPLGLARELSPKCFLQGSYKQATAIHTINDVDVVALCELWQPGSGGGGTRSWGRDDIFKAIAAPLLADGRYAAKVRYGAQSMCVKVDLGIKVEILPVVYKSGIYDFAAEPFRLHRPSTSQWEDGYARKHQEWLTWKNHSTKTEGNFIPAVKILKHIRSTFGLDAVSFHIECLLFSLPDDVFHGAPADYIPAVLTALTAVPANQMYLGVCKTPCGERDIFVPTEWGSSSWLTFHELITKCVTVALAASNASSKTNAIESWQAVLGKDYFPATA